MMKRINVKMAKLIGLSWEQLGVLLAAAIWLPLFWAGLRLLGLSRFQIRMRPRGKLRSDALSLVEIKDRARLVNAAARHSPFPVTCLSRSLTLQWMLQRQGVASQLRIGVRLFQGALDAHAWVEIADVPINDRLDVGEQYAAFGDIPSADSFQAP